MIEAIHVNKLNHNEFRKCDDLIAKIIKTYDARDNAFHIGGASLKFASSDVRLIFGLQCGKRRLDLSPGQRPVTDFIQRRCRDTSRLTSKLVKSLFFEAVKGRTKQDEEDVAKLLGLYMCGKLFFSNSSETISWAFVRYMNDLNTVRMYDWTGAIVAALMGTVKEFHQMLWKVTGCMVAFLYWLCEHSTIIEPQTENMFPRFMKWDIGKLLIKGQGVDLSGPVNFQVKVDRLRSFEYEREMMGANVVMFGDVQADVVDCVGGDDAFVEDGEGIETGKCDAMHTNDLECGFGVVREECSSWEGHKAGSPVGGNAADVLRGSVFVNNSEGVKSSRVDEYVNAIAILELENKRKDGMITLLDGEVDGLKRKLEVQAVNIVGGFECVLGIKNDKVEKLKKENIELRRSLLVLEDQIADRDVHVVTQAFRDVQVRRDGCGGNDDGVKVGGEIVYNVSPIRAGLSPKYVCTEAVGPSVGCDVVDSVGEQRGRCAGGILNVDLCDMDDGLIGSKWSGFDINNLLGVWKMMTVEEKCKIKQGYDRHGDRAVMWEDRDAGVVGNFTDVKNIIRQSAVCGNVIDGYVELLKSEHVKMYGADELEDKSYFFSSVCLDMLKSEDVRGREKFVRTNVSAATDCRFIHFPMCHDGNWTLVVYDTEEGTWKHYNPMRQRGDKADVHYSVATLLIWFLSLNFKDRVTDVMEQTLRELGLDKQSIRANFNSTLEAVTKCPQQKPGTLDCGVLVCAIMRQYVHRADVERSLHGSNCIILRANMVKAFVNDPTRGLKE
ncbi:hypothetical protein LOK49_LG03G01158 [Camellia lanceoleosa]|uniref:Uncharacterized protein n=1 Tax=Camellia lanceoleosa TaxID=1840588 RepID=A0ACC0I721_9ERIC|nr:hypothetical protein LOK49_LG03G01158 [Camellia lanceoleosa]